VDQLPPVGAGKVLTDAIQSGVIPGVDLREIFRQAQQSGIVRTAHAVNGGNFQAVHQGLPTIDPTHVKASLCLSYNSGSELFTVCKQHVWNPSQVSTMRVVEPSMALEVAAATAVCRCLATDWHFVLTVYCDLSSQQLLHASNKANRHCQVGKLKL